MSDELDRPRLITTPDFYYGWPPCTRTQGAAWWGHRAKNLGPAYEPIWERLIGVGYDMQPPSGLLETVNYQRSFVTEEPRYYAVSEGFPLYLADEGDVGYNFGAVVNTGVEPTPSRTLADSYTTGYVLWYYWKMELALQTEKFRLLSLRGIKLASR